MSESPKKLFFFNDSERNTYRNASENSKAKIPSVAHFGKIEFYRGPLCPRRALVGMPVKRKEMQAPHSVSGVPTTDGWDQ